MGSFAESPSTDSYLRSPIVEIVVGAGDAATSLFAHQALLTQSAFLASACEQFTSTTGARRIELPDDDFDATASVLEYLYKADYFPSITAQTSLEPDPAIPQPDDAGVGLLRHARVYTLAQRLGLPALASLAHRKIHLTPSTARGEIAYARFVYRETQPDDENVRKPVAAFWASRSYVLRHEAEVEFKRMCLEFPQFGFDVLSLVLDAQERQSQRSGAAGEAKGTGKGGPGRKRQRVI